MPEVCENSFAARVERSAEPVRTGVAFERMQRGLCRSFAGWPAIVSVAALLVAGCGELSDPTRTECEASHAPSSDRFQELSPAAEKRLQGTLDRVRREQKAPGAAAAVVIGGCLWVGASGIADMRTREPVRVQTMFEVGSVTKTFVAALVLKLAEDGVLGLDDRLSRWVPEFPASRRITLRQLLNHTAGTDDFVGDGRFLAAQRRRGLGDVDTAQLLRYAPEPVAKPRGALELLQRQ